jgi:hypothetical protein
VVAVARVEAMEEAREGPAREEPEAAETREGRLVGELHRPVSEADILHLCYETTPEHVEASAGAES